MHNKNIQVYIHVQAKFYEWQVPNISHHTSERPVDTILSLIQVIIIICYLL